ncbi:unnamed protein product [Rhizopus stolonifer]
MRFSLLLIVISFAASAKAAQFDKRELSDGVQSCVTQLNNAQSSLTDLKTVIDSYDPKNLLGAIDIQNKEQKLEHTITRATDECCKLKNPIDPGEARSLIDLYKSLVPNVDDTLNSLANKKPMVDGNNMITNFVKKDIRVLADYVGAVDKCVLNFIPTDLQREVQDSVDKIVSSFDKVNKAFGI